MIIGRPTRQRRPEHRPAHPQPPLLSRLLAGGVLSLEGWSRRLAVFLAGCLIVGDEALGSGLAKKEEHWQKEP